MATLISALRKLLVDTSAIAAVVGTRVYPVNPPQKATYPLIVLALAGGDVDAHLGGLSGFRQQRVQIDCAAPTYLVSDALADLAIALLGGTASAVHSGKFIDEIEIASAPLQQEWPDTGGGNEGPKVTSFDVKVSYTG